LSSGTWTPPSGSCNGELQSRHAAVIPPYACHVCGGGCSTQTCAPCRRVRLLSKSALCRHLLLYRWQLLRCNTCTASLASKRHLTQAGSCACKWRWSNMFKPW
jgi:hypothetical protein